MQGGIGDGGNSIAVGARFTIYGLMLDRFGPFLEAFSSLLVPPPFALDVVRRLDGGIAGDAVEKACEHVPRRSRVKIAREDGSSGATTTFVGWNGRGELREDNGHVNGGEGVSVNPSCCWAERVSVVA
jgi:hypothetical protein